MPEMVKISSSVLKHIRAVEVQLQLMKDCSVDGLKSIYGLGSGNFLFPIYPRRTVQFIQPYFNIGTRLYLWTSI